MAVLLRAEPKVEEKGTVRRVRRPVVSSCSGAEVADEFERRTKSKCALHRALGTRLFGARSDCELRYKALASSPSDTSDSTSTG